MRWHALLVSVAACYEPPHTTCAIHCTDGAPDNCPDGMTCSAGYCLAPGDVCTTELATVRMGGRHACGLDATGHAVCWGDDHEGQLGVAAITDSSATPIVVDTSTYTAVATGNEHTCAVRTDGSVWCWGQNDSGQARGMHGGTANVPSPVAAPATIPQFDKISAGGAHSCAIGAGQLWCWGRSASLGLGADTQMMTRFAPAVGDFIEVAAGTDHTCAISTSTGVWCFGNNDNGQAGQEPPGGQVATPAIANVGLPATKVAIHISAGDSKNCVIMAGAITDTMGELWCWGYNANEDIAPGGQTVTAARMMSPAATWTQVSAGAVAICGVHDGTGYCWGASTYGQDADGVWEVRRSSAQPAELGPTDEVWVPLQTPDAPNERGFDEGGCARTGTHVRCWGKNAFGEVGTGLVAQRRTPVEVTAPNGMAWQHVWVGDTHSCAQTSDGALWCWGQDTRGALTATNGHGTVSLPCTPDETCDVTRPAAAPTAVHAPDTIAIGNAYTCALDSGAITCWGAPANGQLGSPRDMPAVASVTAPAGQTWTKLYGGDVGTCGVASGGQLLCWGHIVDVDVTSPALVDDPLLADLATLEFGDAFACAAEAGGGRVCWGANNNAQLGDGTIGGGTTSPMLYTDVTVLAMSSRGDHTCAITTGGGIACWGTNGRGQCGDPSMPNVLAPNPITAVGQALASCTQVVAGNAFGCAICAGKPWCWGDGRFYELGRGGTYVDYDAVANAVAVPAGTYVEVGAGTTHACALDNAGKLYCWGLGVHGELGDGSHGYNLPVEIAPL